MLIFVCFDIQDKVSSAFILQPKAVKIILWLSDTQVLFCSEGNKLWEQAIRHLDDETMRRRIIEFARHADLGIEEITKMDNRLVRQHKQYDDEGKETNSVSFTFNKNESEGTIKYCLLLFAPLSESFLICQDRSFSGRAAP